MAVVRRFANVSAFSILSLLFGEALTRGWLRWALENWAQVIHSVAATLPVHLSPLLVKGVAAYLIVTGVVFTSVLVAPGDFNNEADSATALEKVLRSWVPASAALIAFVAFEVTPPG